MGKTLWCMDHDGTASKRDIGGDFLYLLLGYENPGSFVEDVQRMRNDPGYLSHILRKLGHDHYDRGTELSLMLSLRRVPLNDVVENARSQKNHLREGFMEFLGCNPDDKIIVSAGPEKWLSEFYRGVDPSLTVIGTEGEIGPDGRYAGIRRGCGRESKPQRIKNYQNGHRLIVVGDSSNDDRMMALASETGGLSIGVGFEVYADVNVPADKWYPVHLLGEVFKRINGNGDDLPDYLPPSEVSLCGARANTKMGRRVLSKAYTL